MDAAAIELSVRVKPSSSRTRVGGAYGESGQQILVAAVTAAAVDGKATEAVLMAVAKAFGVRRRDVQLVRGHTHRTKVLRIQGDATALAEREKELLGA